MAERRGHLGLTADVGRGRARGSGVRAGIVIAVLVLAVSGCTGNPGPVPSTHGSPGTVLTASPTPSATAAAIPAPERPVAMDRADADGAMAAATYFVSLYPYSYATGDLAAWTAMSDPACVFCRSVVGHVKEMWSLRHTSQGPSLSVSSVKNGPAAAEPGDFLIEMHVEQGPSIEWDAAGAVVDRVDESKSLFLAVALRRDGAGWIVRETSTESVGTRG